MRYELSYNSVTDCVEVITHGSMDVASAIACMIAMVDLARERGCERFFIDHSDTEVAVDLIQASELGLDPAAYGYSLQDRIAVYITRDHTHHRVFEDQVKSQGWGFRYFTDRQTALSWLDEA